MASFIDTLKSKAGAAVAKTREAQQVRVPANLYGDGGNSNEESAEDSKLNDAGVRQGLRQRQKTPQVNNAVYKTSTELRESGVADVGANPEWKMKAADAKVKPVNPKPVNPKLVNPNLKRNIAESIPLQDQNGMFRPDWPAVYPMTSPVVAGRAVPVGFARYIAPVINLGDYVFRRLAAWRVAIPREMEEMRVQLLMQRIWNYGPASAGYVRIGETLVPAMLGPGARNALSGATHVGGERGYNSSGFTTED